MKRILFTILLLVVVSTAALYLYNNEKQKAAAPKDIQIEAVLKPNENERMKGYKYMLEVVIDMKKDSHNMMYPYIPGLGNISLDYNEEKGYYIPGSIATGGGDEQLVMQAIKKNQIIYQKTSFIGFYCPEKAGVYKMRIYFQELDDFKVLDQMYLAYVHRGVRSFGLDNSWVKIIEIKSDSRA